MTRPLELEIGLEIGLEIEIEIETKQSRGSDNDLREEAKSRK